MLAPSLTAHADLVRHHIAVTIHGPLTTTDHGAALAAACLPLPRTYGLLVNLSGVTVITESGLEALRTLAAAAVASGHRIAFVCTELMLRAELVLADLDTVAPVLPTEDDAMPLVGWAA